MEKYGSARKIVCKLCHDIIIDGNYKIITEIVEEVLDVLQLKLIQSEQETNEPAICNACSIKLFAAFNFKATCMDTEDCIFPYVNSGNGAPVDLREIYLKERGKEYVNDILEDERICRLCMQVVTCEFISVKDMDVDMLCVYIPEVNFISTKDPVICAVCYDSLNIHITFLKHCSNVQKNIKQFSDCKIPESPLSIVKEEIDLKFEENYGVTLSSLVDEPITHTNKCSFESATTTDNYMLKHKKKPSKNKIAKHRNSSDGRIYKCDLCDFKTTYKYYIKYHKHKHDPEKWTYKCDSCDFKTVWKDCMNHHRLRHKDISEKQMYKCHSCDYQTHRKNKLNQHHLLRHKNIPESQMYKCDSCNYKSKLKASLQRHQLRHKNITEKLMHTCDSCDYQTDRMDQFNLHQRRHKNISEDQIHKCDLCSYKTIYKQYFTQHLLKHKEKMWHCDSCDFKTNHKVSLARHQLKHKYGPKVKK